MRSKREASNGIASMPATTTSPTPRARATSAPRSDGSRPTAVPKPDSSTMLRPLPQPASRIWGCGGSGRPATRSSTIRRRPRYHQYWSSTARVSLS